MIEISVVVTVYNSQPVLSELIARLTSTLEGTGDSYELIFIEDRGRDSAWTLLKAAALTDKRVRVARMARNFGQHNAITAGIYLSKGRYVVLMDGDLQDKPEIIPKLLAEIRQNKTEIVYVRRINRGESLFKRVTSRMFHALFSRMSGIRVDAAIGTYRIMSRLVCDSYRQFGEVNKFVGGIFYWMNFPAGYLDVEYQARQQGRSTYNLIRLIKLAQLAIVSFSNKPLNLAVYLGFISSMLSFLLGAYFIFNKVFYQINLTGYSSLIVSIYFIGGIILMVLGIIGQYVGQIYDQVRARPEFLLQEKINFDE